MSWDVIFKSSSKSLGTKGQVREEFVAACESITGLEVQRKGPTEVAIDPSFEYEVSFIGYKQAIESLTLSVHLNAGDPHEDPAHPVWSFLGRIHEITGWDVVDAFSGDTVNLGD
ncbi:MAG: hypothetical protein AAGB00_07925 [Planctomycetota bacterium]